jgi:hypothetical protein
MKRYCIGLILLSLTFLSCNSISKSNQQKIIQIDNGKVEFQTSSAFIQIILINNPNKVIKEWDETAESYIPGIPTSIKCKIGETMLPFIIFSSLENKNKKMDISYNAKLKKPNNIYSKNIGENLKIINGDLPPKMFFRSRDTCGWTFDNTDPLGKYSIEIEIFENSKKVTSYSMNFELTS